MNLYVKINGVRYPITQYSYRLNAVDSDTKVSHIFNTVVVSKTAVINQGDTIEFYSNDSLIYSDPINTVIKNGSYFDIQSLKEVLIPVSKNIIVDEVFYYSTVTLRMSLDFDVSPLDTIETVFGNFTAYTLTHSSINTEISING